MDPRTLRIAAVVVAVLTAISAGGVYYAFARQAAQSASCALTNTNPIIVDQPEKPDSLDPAVVFTTPGWGIAQQTYQTLVMYNHTQVTPAPQYMTPLLAKNWSTSPNGLSWNFTMWPNEYFSDGTPLNAYVVWYSLYRGMVMNQPLVFLLEENFYFPGHIYNDLYTNASAVAATQNWLGVILNEFNTRSILTNPPSALLAVMKAANQSFQVLNSTTLEFHIGAGFLDVNGPAPYPYLLDQIATPAYAVVDPLAVYQNGQVVPNSPNSWMANNMLGSGPYNLTFWSPTTGYTLAPNKNYWATAIAAQLPWDNNIQPAKISIDVSFQDDPIIDVQNLKTGAAATASFAYIGPSLLGQLSGNPCLVVNKLPPVYGSLSFSGWIYMDQQPALPGEPMNPFTNWSVRAAVVHAINYAQIISTAFNNNATRWVGPLPPGYPYANNVNLPNYTYDVGLAERFMNASPWPMSAGGLNTVFPNGITFEYLTSGDWNVVAALLKAELAKIDIPLNLVGMSIVQLAVEQAQNGAAQCISDTSSNGGPFYIGINYYTGDYIGPDDASQLNALSFGSYNWCMSELYNSTIDSWVYAAAETQNTALAAQLYGNITKFMYSNYTDAWLVVPTAFQVYNKLLLGTVASPMGSAIPFELEYNQVYVS